MTLRVRKDFMEENNVYQKLLDAQKEISAPRDVDGRFGKARSAEKILEAVKPVCQKYGLLLYTSDVLSSHNGRNYITATAYVVNVDKPEEIVSADAYAWENEALSGLDTSQVSGKTSSYAKKYALQNLFAIDDTKDADVEHTDYQPKNDYQPKKPSAQKATPKQFEMLLSLAKQEGATTRDEAIEHITERAGKDATELTSVEASKVIGEMMKDEN